MYKIYYGTNNTAKINHIKKISENSTVKIIGINELQNINHDINENGKEPIENAKIKALHYWNQIREPVFSVDSGLFFEDVKDEDQPGVFTRGKDKRFTDNEMIEYYSSLAKRYGGEIIGYYKNAICIISVCL